MTDTNSQTTTLLRLEGLALCATALFWFARSSGDWNRLALLILLPDVSLFFYAFGARVGAIAYNLAHSTIGALGLFAVATAAGESQGTAIALIWLAHIGADRALGYGLKETTGFSYTHLGRIGRRNRQKLA